jgi:serpin B
MKKLLFFTIFVSLFTCVITFPLFSQEFGDVNNDTDINIVDALLIAQYYVGLDLNNFNQEKADVDADGSITIVDALLVAQYYVGLISQFPAQIGSDIEVVKSDLQRNGDPQPDTGELESIVEGNNQFGFDFFGVIKDTPDNLFFSPISISYAFAMCYAGANGSTEAEISDVLHFTLPEDRFHNAFNALDLELTSEPDNPVPEMGEELKLTIANSTWGQKDYFFYPQFLDTLAVNYGAAMNTVDFMNEPEPCRQLINQWVSDQTEERIKDLLAPGSIDYLTRLVLVNAIYFKANWYYPFDEEDTYDEDFHLSDGSTTIAPMMHQTLKAYYYEIPGHYQAVKLNYQGMRKNSMIIILPAEGELNSFESAFTLGTFNEIKNGFSTYKVILTVPKFSYRWGDSIKPVLETLGMTESFSWDADFTGITNEERIFIGDVIHKAFVAVDEIGTEAAAATAIIMPGSVGPGPTPEPPPVVTMTINRPFYFLICNDNTQAILFLGRVLVPEQ